MTVLSVCQDLFQSYCAMVREFRTCHWHFCLESRLLMLRPVRRAIVRARVSSHESTHHWSICLALRNSQSSCKRTWCLSHTNERSMIFRYLLEQLFGNFGTRTILWFCSNCKWIYECLTNMITIEIYIDAWVMVPADALCLFRPPALWSVDRRDVVAYQCVRSVAVLLRATFRRVLFAVDRATHCTLPDCCHSRTRVWVICDRLCHEII